MPVTTQPEIVHTPSNYQENVADIMLQVSGKSDATEINEVNCWGKSAYRLNDTAARHRGL